MIDFDYDVLYNEYKSIRSTLQRDGYLLPYVLKVVEVPSEYQYTLAEWGKILKRTSKENKEKLISMSKNRRKTEILIFSGRHEEYVSLDEYRLAEFNEFIENYPRYQDILK